MAQKNLLNPEEFTHRGKYSTGCSCVKDLKMVWSV